MKITNELKQEIFKYITEIKDNTGVMTLEQCISDSFDIPLITAYELVKEFNGNQVIIINQIITDLIQELLDHLPDSTAHDKEDESWEQAYSSLSKEAQDKVRITRNKANAFINKGE